MTATSLSPTRSATAMASKSPSSSSKNNIGTNDKLSAAADLIRNLDAALLEMNNSAAKSADDAARARRNARTAGEVARRYGKTKSAEKSLLEKKREKRAAARLAAEAKQRREHPRSSPVKMVRYNNLNSPSGHRFAQDYGNQSVDLAPRGRDDHVQTNLSDQFSSVIAHYDDDLRNREEHSSMDSQQREPGQPTAMNEDAHVQNEEKFSQNTEQAPSAAEEMGSMNPSSTIRNPPISPRKQPTTSARIRASNAEDVLTLSLELERARSALKAANSQILDMQSQNDELKSQLRNNSTTTFGDQQQSTQVLIEELRLEKNRSKASEEDAALALELARDAQAVKEECEEWLTRSLDEIEFWKNKYLLIEKEFEKQQQHQSLEEIQEECDYESKRLVRFKEKCPPSPVVSVQGGDATVEEIEKVPQPPEYPFHPSPKTDWSTPQTAGNRKFTSTASSEPTPSKSDIAKGRLYLHNASPLSPNGGLSPHVRASELMKRSAETRRILRERLSASGRLDSSGPSPPPSMTHVAAVAAKTKGYTTSTDISQQGNAACKSVGKILYESGQRLKLNSMKANSALGGTLVITTTAALEAVARDYCEQVEGRIGRQKEKLDELTAFCDHLELDFINSR